jgi:poly(3-hydroxybutyrate) depolymerase
VQRFRFDGWAGPALPVWYYRPVTARPDAPVMFIMHGVGRDADRYIAEWVEIARANGIVVVVPEFTRGAFPGSENYNFGAVFDQDGALRPRALWSYSAIEGIFDAVVAREKLTAQRYVLFGHSAGAQFVHRFVLLGAGTRLDRAISANAGSYMLPRESSRWPFGLNGLPKGLWQPAAGLGAPMLVLLGTADNNPAHPSLPNQPEAVAQGPHRLARGQYFYRTGREAAEAAGTAFGWSCALVQGIGHDNGGMAPYAVALLFSKVPPVPGADCNLLKESARLGTP